MTEYTFASHTGTHMDAPFHYFPAAPHLDEIDIQRFTGKGFVVPLRKPPLSEVVKDDLVAYESQMRDSPFVLLSFDWARHFGTKAYFDHPYLGEEAAEYLVSLSVGCLVLDTLTPDAAIPVRPPDHTGPIHRILLGNDVLIVENAASLSPIENRQVTVSAFPMHIRASDGAPVRLVAEVDDELFRNESSDGE
jgi:kynurenine formamidase